MARPERPERNRVDRSSRQLRRFHHAINSDKVFGTLRSESEEDYEVGYRKPPVATRFKKGKSGNPSGRPKRITAELDPGKLLETIDNEEIVVAIDGKPQRMPKAEIHFRQLFNKAIKGDLTAARLIAKMAARYFGPEAKGHSEVQIIVVPNEELYH